MIDNTSTVTSLFGVQKIGKGKSPVLPKEKDAAYNLRDRLNDTVSSEKYLIEAYTTGSKEIICEKLYSLVNDNLNRVKQMHRHLFEEIFNLGEYQADVALSSKLTMRLICLPSIAPNCPIPKISRNFPAFLFTLRPSS